MEEVDMNRVVVVEVDMNPVVVVVFVVEDVVVEVSVAVVEEAMAVKVEVVDFNHSHHLIG